MNRYSVQTCFAHIKAIVDISLRTYHPANEWVSLTLFDCLDRLENLLIVYLSLPATSGITVTSKEFNLYQT